MISIATVTNSGVTSASWREITSSYSWSLGRFTILPDDEMATMMIVMASSEWWSWWLVLKRPGSARWRCNGWEGLGGGGGEPEHHQRVRLLAAHSQLPLPTHDAQGNTTTLPSNAKPALLMVCRSSNTVCLKPRAFILHRLVRHWWIAVVLHNCPCFPADHPWTCKSETALAGCFPVSQLLIQTECRCVAVPPLCQRGGGKEMVRGWAVPAKHLFTSGNLTYDISMLSFFSSASYCLGLDKLGLEEEQEEEAMSWTSTCSSTEDIEQQYEGWERCKSAPLPRTPKPQRRVISSTRPKTGGALLTSSRRYWDALNVPNARKGNFRHK